jgi:Tol biopolymer transport system component
MINADGTNLKRLTQNASDDILPACSPAEEGVIFFLSNRGGAYNIWRLKLTTGSK